VCVDLRLVGGNITQANFVAGFENIGLHLEKCFNIRGRRRVAYIAKFLFSAYLVNMRFISTGVMGIGSRHTHTHTHRKTEREREREREKA